jgi:hypothetical protein
VCARCCMHVHRCATESPWLSCRVVADPGMQVVLVLVPSSITNQVLSRYGLNTSSPATSASHTSERRRLRAASPPPAPSPPAPIPPLPAPMQLLDYDTGALTEPLPTEVLAGSNASAAAPASSGAGGATSGNAGALTDIGPFTFEVPQADTGWGQQQGLLDESGVLAWVGECSAGCTGP